ncbi:MAG: hypothetical protein ACLQGV_17290 [Bryobacteraceae bacterium]
MTDQTAAVAALQRFGYTERQAAFLRIVALHSGYFLARQYDLFADSVAGGPRKRLIDQLVARGHSKELSFCGKTAIYHLCARRLYAALEIENSRNRRPHQPFVLKAKLMALDLILSHPEAQFLATEHDRVELFTDILKLPRTTLPVKFYASKARATRTARYFVDRNPIFLSAAAEGAAPIVGFAYIDAGGDTTAGFRSYLAQYRRLLAALEGFRLVYVASTSRFVEQARKDFSKLLGFDDSMGRERAIEPARLIEHFQARACHERRDYTGFDMAKIDRLADELKQFSGPRFDALFRVFQSQGAPDMLAELARLKTAKAAAHGVFEAQVLPHSYAFLGEV